MTPIKDQETNERDFVVDKTLCDTCGATTQTRIVDGVASLETELHDAQLHDE